MARSCSVCWTSAKGTFKFPLKKVPGIRHHSMRALIAFSGPGSQRAMLFTSDISADDAAGHSRSHLGGSECAPG